MDFILIFKYNLKDLLKIQLVSCNGSTAFPSYLRCIQPVNRMHYRINFLFHGQAIVLSGHTEPSTTVVFEQV